MGDESKGSAGWHRLGSAGRGGTLGVGLVGVPLRDAIGWLVAGRWLEELMIRLECRETKWNGRPW
jgi:hypothetical protein